MGKSFFDDRERHRAPPHALGIGVALAAAPGPVQAVLLTESVRGGVSRGLRALLGAHATFGLLLVALALGVAVAAPTGPWLRVLQVAGGVLLLWLALDAVRAGGAGSTGETGGRSLPPALRGILAIVLNPGGWLFLAAVASPLMAEAARLDGTAGAMLVAGALLAGALVGDVALILGGGLGLRRAGERAERIVRLALAAILAGLGVWLLVAGATP